LPHRLRIQIVRRKHGWTAVCHATDSSVKTEKLTVLNAELARLSEVLAPTHPMIGN